jgi:hypothetical protein
MYDENISQMIYQKILLLGDLVLFSLRINFQQNWI